MSVTTSATRGLLPLLYDPEPGAWLLSIWEPQTPMEASPGASGVWQGRRGPVSSRGPSSAAVWMEVELCSCQAPPSHCTLLTVAKLLGRDGRLGWDHGP